jgi:phosphate acetyltransferase
MVRPSISDLSDPGAGVAAVREFLRESGRRDPRRIAFCPSDDRTLGAAVSLGREGLARPLLVGDPGEIRARADRRGLKLGHVQILDAGVGGLLTEVLRQGCAASGVGSGEAGRGLAWEHARLWALERTGMADAFVLGAPRRDVPPWFGKHARSRLRLYLLRPLRPALACALATVPGEGETVDAGALADVAVRAASLARAITGLAPRITFFAPGVPVFFGAGSRFESARERLERQVRGAAATVRARADTAVEDELALDRIGPVEGQAGEIPLVVLTHSDRPRTEARAAEQMGAALMVGPVCQGESDTWGESGGAEDEETIVDLALATGIGAAAGDRAAQIRGDRKIRDGD